MGFLGVLREKAKTTLESLRGFKLREILQNNPKIGFFGAGALILVLLFCLFMVVWSANGRRKGDQAAAEALAGTFGDLSVAPDELFWPDEPDPVPPVQLERLPRGSSGADDIPYWTDPREAYAGRWRERVGSAMDEIMEKIP
ncbi:MAG: hypothetical protein LBI85_07895 [Spirochaetaceae bacterium]|jgi:hypothetical protein|nr:hypothetical protein [Spirochaetaceae bacterium]